MNISEIFNDNVQLPSKIYTNVYDFLKKSFDLQIGVRQVTTFVSPTPFTVNSLGMFRVNLAMKTGVMCIGTSQPDGGKALEQIVGKSYKNAQGKTFGASIAQLLVESTHAFLRSNNMAGDIKSMIVMSDAQLSGWKTVTTVKSLRLPFGIESTEIVLDIPIFDDKARSDLTQEYFGFPESARILVVDDSPITRKMNKQILNSYGYLNVAEFADGSQALSQLCSGKEKFDLVIADWHMPNLTGIQLLQAVRAMPSIKDLPLIMVTGERNKTEVQTALTEGASGYIVKPYENDVFLKAMKRASICVRMAPPKAA